VASNIKDGSIFRARSATYRFPKTLIERPTRYSCQAELFFRARVQLTQPGREERFMPWRTTDGEIIAPKGQPQRVRGSRRSSQVITNSTQCPLQIVAAIRMDGRLSDQIATHRKRSEKLAKPSRPVFTCVLFGKGDSCRDLPHGRLSKRAPQAHGGSSSPLVRSSARCAISPRWAPCLRSPRRYSFQTSLALP
jgi:hypothetical protein